MKALKENICCIAAEFQITITSANLCCNSWISHRCTRSPVVRLNIQLMFFSKVIKHPAFNLFYKQIKNEGWLSNNKGRFIQKTAAYLVSLVETTNTVGRRKYFIIILFPYAGSTLTKVYSTNLILSQFLLPVPFAVLAWNTSPSITLAGYRYLDSSWSCSCTVALRFFTLVCLSHSM